MKYLRYSNVLLNSKGKLIEVPLRMGEGDSAFIDAISFTFHVSTIKKEIEFPFFNEDDVIRHLSLKLYEIFGFAISEKAKHTGGRFYESCYLMNADGVHYGSVHIGGQNDTILIEVSGTGCQVAKDDWETRLYHFLRKAERPFIARLDVAKDFYQAEITPDSAWQAWNDGKFNKRGKSPIVDRYGSDWDCNTNKGKTLYVGSRQSFIFARIYDKAKQFGDLSKSWTRFEIQFKGRYGQIELTDLLNPGALFGGAFPICEELQTVDVGVVQRAVANKERAELSIQSVREYAKKQVGRAINLFLELGMTAEELVADLRDSYGRIPDRMNAAAYVAIERYKYWLHERPVQHDHVAELF